MGCDCEDHKKYDGSWATMSTGTKALSVWWGFVTVALYIVAGFAMYKHYNP
jgi:hypothetical protein